MDITNEPTTVRAGRREWLGLAVLALPILLISVDFSVLNLALPKLASDLAPNSSQQLWILDIYGFMIAGFLITMGTLGDRIGRRRLMLCGAAAFGACSVLAAYAASPGMLITARALMGVAGATLAPSGLALIGTMFADPKQRAAAVAAFTSCFMGGAIIGPIAGGVLLAHFWWGSVFLLAVPVMLLLLIAGPLLLPEYRNPDAGRLDILSVALSLAAILPTVYGITELSRNTHQPLAWASVALGALVFGAFVLRQRTLQQPLLELRLFSNRIFRGAFTLSLLVGAVQGGSILMINLYLQTVLGYSTLRAGLWMVPPAVAMLLTIGLGPALARTIRPAYITAAGLTVAALGYALITQVNTTTGLPALIIGFAIAMAGIGPGLALGYDLVLGAAPAEMAGSASATAETGGQFGVAAGVAVLGSIGAAVYRAHMPAPMALPPIPAGQAHESIAGAITVAHDVPPTLRYEVLESARTAFTTGLHTVAAIGAVVFIALAALAIVELRQALPSNKIQPDNT
ncbi:MAG: qacA5 [Nocardia sp.]|uniref:MFS transporter n=1 Tax=Nocardia sp. TaxID=1821 RepID=UPI0026381C05|nr:MFS transporter [Nocardia sp.]MCU1640153.1 qacA5 [Nocardia sp.]